MFNASLVCELAEERSGAGIALLRSAQGGPMRPADIILCKTQHHEDLPRIRRTMGVEMINPIEVS